MKEDSYVETLPTRIYNVGFVHLILSKNVVHNVGKGDNQNYASCVQ